MNKPLTVTLHIGGKQVETLTEEQCEKMAQRLSETMSRYYTNHIDEYQKIKEK
jgi:ABC-type transporter MlaC component